MPRTLALTALFLALGRALSAASGDLVLGFQLSDGSGCNRGLLINVGNLDSLVGKGWSDLGNFACDFSKTFGKGWAEKETLAWSGVGASSSQSGATLFLTSAACESPLDGKTVASDALTLSSTASVAGANDALRDLNRLLGCNEVSLVRTVRSSAWNNLSERFYDNTAEGDRSPYEVIGACSTDVYAFDLTQPESKGRYCGTLKLYTCGELVFVSDPSSAQTGGAAIPEPSTYAGLLGLSALGLAVRRRLKRASR